MPVFHPRNLRLPAILLVASFVVAVAGCGSSAPTTPASTSPGPSSTPAATGSAPATADPSDPFAAVYAEIEAEVSALRGLEPLSPVDRRIVSRDELGEILAELVVEDAPPELLASYELLYQAMGLMDPDSSLADVYVELLESQVGGLYLPSEERLYVVSREGELGAIERVLFAHEFEHALQDQHFDLEAVQVDLVDQTDRQLARQALIEGDAYVLNTQWMLQNLSGQELQELFAFSSDPETLEALERIPPIVQASILFAATQGTQWVTQVLGRGDWAAVDDAWARPPESTEQILHIEKYESGEDPIEVELPDGLPERLGEAWALTLEDTFGEHQLGIWLAGEDAPSGIVATLPETAALAAEGWGGDRVALLSGPDGATAVLIETAWDSAADAGEFAERAAAVFDELGVLGIVARQPDSTSARVLIGSDDATLLLLDRTFGLSGV